METLTEKNFKPQVGDAAPSMVIFTNRTKEDFTYSFNKVPYTFKVGVPVQTERGIAEHFAKHLANRELLKEGRETDTSPKKNQEGLVENPFFLAYFNKYISETSSETSKNVTPEPIVVTETKPRGRPKITKEEEFEEVPVPNEDSN